MESGIYLGINPVNSSISSFSLYPFIIFSGRPGGGPFKSLFFSSSVLSLSLSELLSLLSSSIFLFVIRFILSFILLISKFILFMQSSAFCKISFKSYVFSFFKISMISSYKFEYLVINLDGVKYIYLNKQ